MESILPPISTLSGDSTGTFDPWIEDAAVSILRGLGCGFSHLPDIVSHLDDIYI